jgi:hypothetical protein
VIYVKNLNDGHVKEICTDVASLYQSFIVEHNIAGINDFDKYLVLRSKKMEFDFRDTVALKTLNFNTYSLHNSKEIGRLIAKNHLRDSLKKINKLEEFLSTEFYQYEDARDSILKIISDSITKLRPLTAEESKMIGDLHEIYFDKYYTDPIYDKNRTVSSNGRRFMVIWNDKIKKYGIKYFGLSKEIERLTNKFFTNYYKHYGLSFCHMAFKNGITTFIADESGIVSYGGIVN